MNLNVVDTMIEAKSAKKPHNRPVFSEMIQRKPLGTIHPETDSGDAREGVEP